MLRKIVAGVQNVVAEWSRSIEPAVKRLLDPARDHANIMAGAAYDAVRPRAELIAENALLRRQLIVVRRKIKRPMLSDNDRIVMVLLARLNTAWRDALHLVKPETLLRWHRDLFKLCWRRKSRSAGDRPRRLSKDTIELIMAMARDNVTWGSREPEQGPQQVERTRSGTGRHGCSFAPRRHPGNPRQPRTWWRPVRGTRAQCSDGLSFRTRRGVTFHK